MSVWAAAGVWLLLLALLALEFVAGALPGAGFVPSLIGLAMALLVAVGFMGLTRLRGPGAIFAMAGVFWLCVLLGMGSLDPATRHDIPVAMRTAP